jgi:phage terminase large subunit GpA-like protein
VAPKATSSTVQLVGTGWHLVSLAEKDYQLVHLDANHWKTRLQTAIVSEQDTPGSLTLFDGTTTEHDEYKRHLCSEKSTLKQKFVDGQWNVKEVWERVGKQNHFLDGTCYALAAVDFIRFVRGVRAAESTAAGAAQREPGQGLATPDGRAFFVGGRT